MTIPVIDRFLQYLRYELNLSPRTVGCYGTDLRQWAEWATGGDVAALDAASVTGGDVRAWLASRSRQGDCAGTLRHKLQALRSLYRYLMRQGEVSQNPAAEVELAKLPRRLPHFVREKQLDALLDAEVDTGDFTAVRNHLMLLMLYTTGLRRAELIDLLDERVDTVQCQLKVHGKRDKDRIVPFGEELRCWIERYRSLRAALHPECGNLLVTASGRPLYPSLVYHVVHDSLAEAGASGKLSPHVLRHSFASAMLNHGAELNSVKELLGHESLAATQVYTHVSFRELKNNYQLAHPRALKKGGKYGN